MVGRTVLGLLLPPSPTCHNSKRSDVAAHRGSGKVGKEKRKGNWRDISARLVTLEMSDMSGGRDLDDRYDALERSIGFCHRESVPTQRKVLTAAPEIYGFVWQTECQRSVVPTVSLIVPRLTFLPRLVYIWCSLPSSHGDRREEHRMVIECARIHLDIAYWCCIRKYIGGGCVSGVECDINRTESEEHFICHLHSRRGREKTKIGK